MNMWHELGLFAIAFQVSQMPLLSSDLPIQKISRQVVLQELPPARFHWETKLDLGSLPVGGTAELKLEILNKTQRAVRLNHFDSTCRCTVQTKKIGVLQPGDSASVTVELTPNASRPQNAFRFSLSDGPGLRDRLIVLGEYDLRGFLKFSQPQYRIEFRDLRSERALEPIKLPFTYTEPVALPNLLVKGTGALGEASFIVSQSGTQPFLLIEVDKTAVGDFGLFGNVYLKDESTNAVATCQLTVTKVGDFVFSPRKVLMVWDDESTCYVGTAIFRLYENPRGGQLSAEAPLELKVVPESKIGFEVKLQCMDQVGLVHRIQLRSNTADAGETASLELQFLCEGKRFFHTCELYFDGTPNCT